MTRHTGAFSSIQRSFSCMPAHEVPPLGTLIVIEKLIEARKLSEVASHIKGFLWRGPDINPR